jgi:hypothetical protein
VSSFDVRLFCNSKIRKRLLQVFHRMLDNNQLEEENMTRKAGTRARVLASPIGRMMPFLLWLLLPERVERKQASSREQSPHGEREQWALWFFRLPHRTLLPTSHL